MEKSDAGLSDIENQDKVDGERRKTRTPKPRQRRRPPGFGATIGEMIAAKGKSHGESPKTT